MFTARSLFAQVVVALLFGAVLSAESASAATQAIRVDKNTAPLAGPLTRETIEARTREFLAKLPDLKIDVRDLVLSRAESQAPKNPAAGVTWYVAYKQTYRGLVVFDASVRLVVVGAKVVSVRTDIHPGIERSVEPRVKVEAALSSVSLPGTKPVSSELIIAPRLEDKRVVHHLAWLIVMPVEKAPYGIANPAPKSAPKDNRANELVPVQWRYLIDADTGAILQRRNLIVYDNVTGTVTGQVRPNAPADAAATQPISRMRVQVQQGAITQSAETDVAGNYTVMGLAPGAGTLTAHFTNSHVQVFNDETPDPDATHTAPVTAAGTHNWDWSANDPSPLFVETNTFYHVNRIRDWFLRGAPFDVSPLPDPMIVNVRNGPYCNAGAGGSGLAFGSGIPGSCEDFAMCSDVVYHEYTHRIVDAVYAGSGVDLYGTEVLGSMNEAFGDFFGGSLTNDGSNGEGCYAGRNFDTPDHRYPDDVWGEVHYDGIIFGGALWDLRAVLPIADVDSLAIRAMKRTPIDFSDYLAAVLEEDDNPAYSADPSANNDPADGTPNIDAICHVYFDLHGIFHPYCVGHITTPVAIITAPPPLAFNLETVATLTIQGTAIAGSVSPFGAYSIEYALEGPAPTWVSAGVTLTGGGFSPVPAGTLGTIALGALADGVYRVRLRVFDTASAMAVAKTTFVIDHSIKPGWPQASGVQFYGTPAVANLDPAVAGNEIVAGGDDGYLYAWHVNGTTVPGWPRIVGFPLGAPAVADMDGDGTLEVVIASFYGGVSAFHQDGTNVAGWPQSTGTDNIYGTVALADLDGDGKLEVIAVTSTQVRAWHADGTPVAGWPVTPGVEMHGSPAIGDIDGDGLPEIVVGTQDGRVFAWHHDGTPVVGWPQVLPGASEVSTAVALGDLDGDGLLEVIAAGADKTTWVDHKAIAWRADGTVLPGWPQDLTQMSAEPASIGLADVDGDGVLEIVVMSNDDKVHIFRVDGTALAGWPPPGTGFSGYEFRPSSPSIADLDGDGSMEIVAEGTQTLFDGAAVNKVFAYHHDGTPMAGWPKFVSNYGNTSPAIADVDGDGHTDVVIGSSGVFLWGLPGTYDKNGAEWPTYRGNNRRTGAYQPKAGVVLLFDTSGSMEWAPDGMIGVPIGNRRITFAKNAALPFLEELNDFNAGKANFGIAEFPAQPASFACDAKAVTPPTVITDASKAIAVTTTIPGLTTGGSTPLLAGMATAASMVEGQRNAAIVLLTDGYHNCPTFVTPGDPSVTSLITRLNNNATRVFSIGFGAPTDPDYPLLEAFADQTTPPGFAGSQFYDVTTPAFDPATWTPATALQDTYKSILVDALGLQAAIDPLAVIASGATSSHSVHLNESDRRVSFFVSWRTAQPGRLQLAVKASDGTVVPVGASGVRSHLGDTYAIVTLDKSYLGLAGKLTPAPWTLIVKAAGVPAGQSEPYQYSVIVDSALRFAPQFGPLKWLSLDKLLITAKLTERAKPVPGQPKVWVELTRPGEGLGDWLSRHTVTPEELKQVPEKRGSEPLQPFQRKAIYLRDIKKVKLPAPVFGQKMQLYDDGTHGDVKAGDGIYSAVVTATKPGVYSFHFHATGQTAKGFTYDRDRVMQKYVQVNARPESAKVDVRRMAVGQVQVIVKPQDAAGNLLGPGHAARLKVQAFNARQPGALVDALDGTYRQIIETAPEPPKEMKVTVTIDGRSATVTRPVVGKGP